MAGPEVHGLDEVLLGFVQRLREAGLVVPTDRVVTMLRAVGLVDLLDRDMVAGATRATLCCSPDDVATHDRIFAEYFSAVPQLRWPATAVEVEARVPDDGGEGVGPAEPGPPREVAHRGERLRTRPLRDLAAAERDEALAMVAALQLDRPVRRVRRRANGGHRIDPRATTRAMLRRGGEVVDVRHRERALRPRRVVVLVDVSGSMKQWAEVNLRFAHALRRTHAAEVFTLATRLTRVTAELSGRDVGASIAAAGACVPDWTGGTRLAAGLNHLVDDWGRRGPLRGAVLVLMSDGLDTGEPHEVAAAMARVARLAHKVVWVHPRAGVEGWQPATRALVAALPLTDELVAGGSVAELALVGRAIARPGGRVMAGA
ncbi:vWA domain-containing protein [Propionibacteriaceae bacterium G1746]|uniref:vWA domain-containing protein n=1 Tax=Aestuariimicrobium sp. G57 TaxID=3418485 RepID=UPI003C28D048